MKFWMTTLVFFFFVGLIKSQSAGLRFDPKWTMAESKAVNFLSPRHSEKPITKLLLPYAWCYADLAFFCKVEVKMEKAARLPIKFRLGDVQYVDRLEGKRR